MAESLSSRALAGERTLNVNVGILGHVDSGKTSLARALSTLLSTAALDKHPQSAERGITLDLGFSAFQVDVPPALSHLPYDKLQFTLVDCPGHASLIRTIIGGAQIIDIMLLVVDVTKGFQTQTAECLVVGEISPTQSMLVVLNKTDALPETTRKALVEKMSRRVAATMKGTKFQNPRIVATSVAPDRAPEGVDVLVQRLLEHVGEVRRRSSSAEDPFLFAVDHCFPIKGQGTVLTGTVLQGSVRVNDVVEFPALKLQKKVKSMQMFHRPVTSASQGDRVGICVVQLDAKVMERGIAATPGSVPVVTAVVARVQRIRFHKSKVASRAKYHVTIGHATLMAEVTFFAHKRDSTAASDHARPAFSFAEDYLYREELGEARESAGGAEEVSRDAGAASAAGVDECQDVFALLKFEGSLVCPANALLIGSRLDFDVHSPTCRLAFHGRVECPVDPGPGAQSLRVFKIKRREGVIERMIDARVAIGKGLFKKETDFTLFLGLKVLGPGGCVGVLQSSFGKSGKFKVVFADDIPGGMEDKSLVLIFKKSIFDKNIKLAQ